MMDFRMYDVDVGFTVIIKRLIWQIPSCGL